MDTEGKPSTEIKLNPQPELPLRDGLVRLKAAALDRYRKYNKLVLVVHGMSGVGKSWIAERVQETHLGSDVPEGNVIMPKNFQEIRYNVNRPDNTVEGIETETELTQGNFPSVAERKVLVTTMAGNADWLKERFKDDPRVMYVEVVCDDETLKKNLYERRLQQWIRDGESENDARRLAQRDLEKDVAAMKGDYLPSQDPPSDLTIDTSEKFRIDAGQARDLLTQ